MYKDIIMYRLAEGVSEDQLREVADKVIAGWMNSQTGFLGWEIHSVSDGSYVDIVYWDDENCAKECEKNMAGKGEDPSKALNPELAGAWYGCYAQDSVKSLKASVIVQYENKN